MQDTSHSIVTCVTFEQISSFNALMLLNRVHANQMYHGFESRYGNTCFVLKGLSTTYTYLDT